MKLNHAAILPLSLLLIPRKRISTHLSLWMCWSSLITLGFGPFSLSSMMAQTVTPQSPRAVLRQFYIATGGDHWKPLAQADTSGTYIVGGIKGTFQEIVDLQKGGDVFTYKVGPLQGRQATLPQSSWETDQSGLPMLHDGPEAKADAVTEAFQDRNGWFHTTDDEATLIGAKDSDGYHYDLIRIIPAGGRSMTLWIDSHDHLLKRIVQAGADHQKSTTYLSDYRRVDGVLYPFSLRQSNGDASQDTVQMAQVVRFSPRVDTAKFAMPPSKITDALLLGDQSSAVVPFQIVDGRILVALSINGHPPLPFLFDTGAGNYLTPEAAKELGVEGTGNVAESGVGSSQWNVGLATIKEMRLGPVQLSDQLFVVGPLPSFLQDRGKEPPIAGLIGYEVLRRFPTMFDYDKRELTFLKPGSTIENALGSQQIRLYFNDHGPFIKIAVDGTPGYFGIDTGDSSTTTLFGPFYNAHKFPIEFPVQERMQGGFGGEGRAVRTRIGTLSIGPWVLRRPVISLNFAATGVYSYSYTGGNLGYGLLKNFIFTLDYEHHLAYLRKSDVFGEPARYDRSGMTLRRTDTGDVVIKEVSPNTPAAAAGLRSGDQVLSLNGQSPADLALYRFEDVLSDKAGTTINVRYEREGQKQSATLTLRELLPLDGNFRPYQK